MVYARKIIQPKDREHLHRHPDGRQLTIPVSDLPEVPVFARDMSGANNRAWYAPQQTEAPYAMLP